MVIVLLNVLIITHLYKGYVYQVLHKVAAMQIVKNVIKEIGNFVLNVKDNRTSLILFLKNVYLTINVLMALMLIKVLIFALIVKLQDVNSANHKLCVLHVMIS